MQLLHNHKIYFLPGQSLARLHWWASSSLFFWSGYWFWINALSNTFINLIWFKLDLIIYCFKDFFLLNTSKCSGLKRNEVRLATSPTYVVLVTFANEGGNVKLSFLINLSEFSRFFVFWLVVNVILCAWTFYIESKALIILFLKRKKKRKKNNDK